jgi:hypothetical protein
MVTDGSASTMAADRPRGTAPTPPITLLVEESKGNPEQMLVKSGTFAIKKLRAACGDGAPQPPQLIAIVSHSTSCRASASRLTSACFVSMFGTRRTSLELSVRASGSRTLLAILHILFNFATLLCRKLLLFETVASVREDAAAYIIAPLSLIQIVGVAVFDVWSKEPGVRLRAVRNLLLLFALLGRQISLDRECRSRLMCWPIDDRPSFH